MTPLLATDIQITSEEVSQQLSRLQSHKFAGPDQCHLHVCAIPMTLIYDKFLKDGILPDFWKEATTVVAIHKKGSKRDVSNH